MSVEKRIFYNTLAQTVGKSFATLLGIVTVALLSRYLKEAGFGQYSTIIAFLGLFSVMADLGLYLFVVREISKPGTNHAQILNNALGLRLAAAVLTLSLGALIALLFPYDPLVKKTMFVGIGVFLFVSINQVLIGVFQKHLVQHLVVVSETIGRALNLVLVYLFIREGLSLPFFVLALLFGNAASFFLTLKFARRYERFGIGFDLKIWKAIVTASWPLIFAVFLNLLYFKTDTVILSIFQPEEAVGIYALPYKILEGLLAFPAMFVGLIMPLLSQAAFSASWQKFKTILQNSFDALVLTAVLVVTTFIIFAQKIIDLFKGQEHYLDSPQVLQILVLAAATIFLGTLFGYAVVAVDEQKKMIKGYLLGAGVGLVLYFLLIPRFSYWGAAWGTVISEIVVASFAYFLVRQKSGQKISLKILRPTVPALLVLIGFFKFATLPWILEITIGGALYIAALVVFQAIPAGFVREIIFARTPSPPPPPSTSAGRHEGEIKRGS